MRHLSQAIEEKKRFKKIIPFTLMYRPWGKKRLMTNFKKMNNVLAKTKGNRHALPV
jgi:hypothetical protein